MSSFADSLKDQKERQRQSIEKVLRQHADEVVAKETSSINENYKNVLSGYQGAQSQYTTASEFDALDNRRKSFLNQGDMLLKWIPLSSLSDEDKDTLTTEVKRLQSFTDSGYAQKYSDSGEKWQPNGNDEFFSLNQLGENLRNQYGWYKDAEEYETLNKLESISDIQAYIEEQKSAGTVKEGLLQRIERKPKQSAAKAAFYAMDAAATGNPAKLINAIREEKDTGRYINQDKIDRANEFLDSKKYQKYIGNKTYAETMAQAAEWLKTGEIDRADYNWIKNTAYGMDISVSDYETELQRLQNLKGELEAQRDSLESERKGMTLYDNVNEHAYEYYAPENQQRANELTTEINKLQNDIEQAGADIEAITENYHYDEYKQEYEALDTSIKEEIDALANAGKIIDSDGKKYLQFYDPRKQALKEQGYSDDEIDRLVKRRQRIVNREKAIEDMQKWSEFADKHPVISSVTSVPASLVSGLSALPETVRGMVEGNKGYEYGVDRYTAGFAPTRYTRSVRGTVTQGIDDEVGQFVYQTVMSMADSAGAMGIGVLTGGASGVAGVVTNVIMSSSAGANAIYEGLEKGYSNNKALFLGISAGLIEAASEKIPLDTILDSIQKGSFVKSLGKAFLAEGGEELASNWGNRIMDVLANKSQNEVSKAIRDYEDQGYSESEALARALTDMAGEDTLSFLAGGLSGMAMAGAGKAVHTAFAKGSAAVQNRSDTKAAMRNGKGDNLVQTALSILPSDSKAYKIAEKYTAENAPALTKSDAAQMMKEVNKKRLSQVSDAVQRGQKNAIIEELTNRGVEAPETMANVAYKALTGQEMTADEIALSEKSEDVQSIIKELRSDEKSSFAEYFWDQSTKESAKAIRESETLYQHITGRKVEAIARPLINQKGQTVVRVQQITAMHEDGSMTVTVKDGKGNESERRITLDDISDRSGLAQAVFEEAASQNSVEAANAYIEAASQETNLSVPEQPAAFDAYYLLGQSGIAIDSGDTGLFAAFSDQRLSSVIGKASDTFKQIAYEAGKADAAGVKKGVSYLGRLTKADVVAAYQKSLGKDAGKVIDFIDAVAKKYGMDVQFAPLADGNNGGFVSGTNKILMGLDIDDGTLTRTMGHEMFHYLGEVNTKGAKALQADVIAWLKEKGTYEKAYGDYAEKYNTLLEGRSEAEKRAYLHEEIAADSCFDALSNDQFLKDFEAKTDKSILEKIASFIRDLGHMLRKALQSFAVSHQSDTLVNELLKDKEMLDYINAKFAEILEDVQEGKNEIVSPDSKVRYSIDPDFAKEFDKWNKNTVGFSFKIGSTSEVLQKLGIDEKNIRWDASKIKKIMQKHPAMTADVIKQVPNILENPILVMESLTKEGRITLFGDVIDQNGNPVLAAIELNPTNKEGSQLNIIKIASAYGKDSNPQSLIDRSHILYIEPNQKRTHNWLKVNRLQLPFPSSSYGFLDTIVPQRAPSVNSQYMQNSENDTGGEIEYQLSSETLEQKQMRALVQQNEALQAQNERLKKEVILTKHKVPNEKALRQYMGGILNIFGINATRGTFNAACDKMRAAYECLANVKGPNPNQTIAVNTAQAYALGAAADLVKASKQYEVSDGIGIWNRKGSELWLAADVEMALAQQLLDAALDDQVIPTEKTFADKKREQQYQKLREQSAHYQERLKQRTADKNAQIEALKEEYRERIAKKRSAAATRELQGKITRMADAMQARLFAPKENRYIPKDFQGMIVAVLELLSSDDYWAGDKLAKYDRMIAGAKSDARREALQATRNRIAKQAAKIDSVMPPTVGAAIEALYNTYNKMYKSKDAAEAAAYDPTVSGMLEKLSEDLKGVSRAQMSYEQLEAVYKVMRAADKTVRDSVRLKNSDMKKNIFETGKDLIREVTSAEKDKSGVLSGYLQSMMSAATFFERLGGYTKNSAWVQLYNELNDAQRQMLAIEMNGTKMFDPLMAGKENQKNLRAMVDPKNTVDVGLKDAKGNTIRLTHDMLVSLYLHLLNEDNVRHLERGGLTVPDMQEYYSGDKSKAYANKGIRTDVTSQRLANHADTRHEAEQRLYEAQESGDEKAAKKAQEEIDGFEEKAKQITEEGVLETARLREAVESALTDYDRQWIETAQTFFRYSGDLINETTYQRYGFAKATIDNYFPIRADSHFTTKTMDGIVYDMSIDGMGILKERVNASNPMLLEGITSVVASHLDQVSKYAGLSIAVDNFNKLYNMMDTGYRTSVKEAIDRKFGSKNGTQYLENIIEDLIGAGGGKRSFADHLLAAVRGNMAAAVLTLNARVTLLQSASYPTAAAVLGWKPLIKALGRKDIDSKFVFSRADQEMIAKYTPLLWKRMQGYSSTNLGDTYQSAKLSKRVGDHTLVKKAFGTINAMDGATVGRLWYAAQYYVDENFTDFTHGSEAWYEKVAEMFNQTVEQTQPNYTALQRTGLARSKNPFVKSLAMFTTQRFQNFNIAYSAAARCIQYQKDYKDGKNGVTKADVKQARKQVGRSLSSLIVAGVDIALSRFLVQALLHNLKGYRDDDDELTAESITMYTGLYLVESLSSNVLFGSEIYAAISSIITGEKYYTPELSGISTLFDTIGDAAKAGGAIRESIFDTEAETLEDRWEKSLNSVKRLTFDICTVFGIPAKNAETIVRAAVEHAKSVKGVVDGTIDGKQIKYFDSDLGDLSPKEQAKLAYVRNEGADERGRQLRKLYDDAPSEKQSKVKNGISEFYADKYKDADEKGRTELFDELYKTGLWSKTQLTKMTDGWEFKKEHPKETFSQTDELYQAFSTGQGIPQAMDNYKRYTNKTGKEADLFAKDAAKRQCRQAYIDGAMDDKTATNYIRQYFVVKSVNKTLASWKEAKAKKEAKEAFMADELTAKEAIK